MIKIGSKYYPFSNSDHKYYDYDNNRLMVYDDDDGWVPVVYNPTVFDQVPADFINYLKTGNFTLVQG